MHSIFTQTRVLAFLWAALFALLVGVLIAAVSFRLKKQHPVIRFGICTPFILFLYPIFKTGEHVFGTIAVLVNTYHSPLKPGPEEWISHHQIVVSWLLETLFSEAVIPHLIFHFVGVVLVFSVSISLLSRPEFPFALSAALRPAITVFFTILTFFLYPVLRVLMILTEPSGGPKLRLLRGVSVYRDARKGFSALRRELSKERSKKDQAGIEIFPGITIPLHYERLNFLLAGGMGSGKTVWLMGILDQMLNREDHCLVLDVKGDFAQIYSGKPGCIVFGLLDERSPPWNIAADVSTPLEAQEFATMLIPVGKAGGANDFFKLAARDVVAGAIIVCQRAAGFDWGFRDIVKVISDNLQLYKLLEEYRPSALQSLSDCTLIEVQDEVTGAKSERLQVGKTSAGILQQIRSQTQLIDFLAEAWPYSADGFSITKWTRCELPDVQLVLLQYRERYQSISQFFASQVLDLYFKEILSLPDSQDRRLGCVLDELGFLPRIPSFVTAAKGGRSKGLRMFVGVQENAVIESTYKEDGGKEAINTGFSNKLIGRGETSEFAEYWSKSFGRNLYERTTKTRTRSRGGVSISEKKEEVVLNAIETGDILSIKPASIKNGAEFYLKLAGGSIAKLKWPIIPRERPYPAHVIPKWLLRPEIEKALSPEMRDLEGLAPSIETVSTDIEPFNLPLEETPHQPQMLTVEGAIPALPRV